MANLVYNQGKAAVLSILTFAHLPMYSLSADVLWGSSVTYSFLPHGAERGRNECVTNEPQRTSAGRLANVWTAYSSWKHLP